MPMFSNIFSHTKYSSGSIKKLIKKTLVYISTLALEDTESNKFLNYCRQVWNSQSTTDTLVLRKSIEQRELMKIAQTFQKPKML